MRAAALGRREGGWAVPRPRGHSSLHPQTARAVDAASPVEGTAAGPRERKESAPGSVHKQKVSVEQGPRQALTNAAAHTLASH